MGCCRAHDAGKIPAGERDPYVAPARRQDGGVEIAEPARGAVGQPSRAPPDPGDAGARRDERPDGDAQPNVNSSFESLDKRRIVGDDRLDHRVAISDRARHPAAEMERNLKPHRRRVQGILVDERDLEPEAGALDRRRASCRPSPDHEQLDALARRQPLAVGGDRVEPSNSKHHSHPAALVRCDGAPGASVSKNDSVIHSQPKNSLGSNAQNLSSSFSSFRRAVCTPSRGRGSAGRRYRWSANRRGSRRSRRRAR